MSAMEKAPWMPDFQKDEWVQYFLLEKVSRPGNFSLAQPHVPPDPLTTRRGGAGCRSHPSLKKCSSPLISVMASKFFSMQASQLGSTGMGSVVGSGVSSSSSSSVVEVLPASVGMGWGSSVGMGTGAVGSGPEPRPG